MILWDFSVPGNYNRVLMNHSIEHLGFGQFHVREFFFCDNQKLSCRETFRLNYVLQDAYEHVQKYVFRKLTSYARTHSHVSTGCKPTVHQNREVLTILHLA